MDICLDKEKDRIHEATTYFNVITNTFNIFFSSMIDKILNRVRRKMALSIRKFQGKGIPTKIKKTLGQMLNTRALIMVLPPNKAQKWK